jgi:endonuclease/exonuclease/phosphatase family metal-dependent hydrolase
MFGRILVKGTMLLANIAVAVLLIVTVLASRISPEKLVLPALTTLIFPLTIALNVFFVAFWLFAKKWHFLISLVLLFMASEQISNIIPLHFGKTKTETSTKSFKIMSYNTMLFSHLQKHTANNPNKIIKHILESDADIVCLQEFAVSSKKKSEYLTYNDIFRIFSDYKYKYIEFNQYQKWKRSGIAVLSKYPIINNVNFSDKADYGVSTYSDIVIKGDTIRLFNNHLESNRLTERDRHLPLDLKDDFNSDKLSGTTKRLSNKLFIAYKIRAKQAERLSAKIKQSPYKVLVCGDFNDVPGSYTYSTIKGDLTDAFSTSGLGLGLTLNLSIYRFRIDYLLYDAQYFSSDELMIDKVKYSDHYPIHTRISFKQKS